MRLPLSTLFRPATLGRAARIALVFLFLWLVARHWHPHYGFTRFLQADPDVASKIVPALRGAPVYVHPEPGSYDGFYYAEIATDPTLRDPALAGAVDDLGYRARRILLGALAWTIGCGEPVATVRAYAWLNLFAWLALTALLWRLFPVGEWRGTIAWAGVLFATGTLLSVRFALTDLAALLMTAAALIAIERRRRGGAIAWLGLAGLARETALLGVVALLPSRRETSRARVRACAAIALAAAPLALWLVYLWVTIGSSGHGLGNFTWPLVGGLKKADALLGAWRTEPNRALVVSTVLAYAALAVQGLFLLRQPAPGNPWWRLGAAFAALLLCLGPAVWGDDLPGAAVRVLLPLGLAFNVLAVRGRAAAAWLVLGNLSVVGGVWALWPISRDAHEFAAGKFSSGSYIIHTDAAWFPTELGRHGAMAWCPRDGALAFDAWPHDARSVHLALAVRALTAREVEIRRGERALWRGSIDGRTQWIELPAQPLRDGRLELTLHTDAPPAQEPAAAGGRELGFAICGVRVE